MIVPGPIQGTGPGPLFTSHAFGRQRPDKRLVAASVWKIVRQYGAKVGVRAWPHGLRHSAITEVLELTNGNIRAAQRFAAHSTPAITGRYDDNRIDIAGDMAGLLAKRIADARKK